jgi:hypothetical protein
MVQQFGFQADLCSATVTYFENKTQNKRSIGDTRGRFADFFSIASCWRSARFSSVNWRRDLNKEPTIASNMQIRLSMWFMLQ